MCIPASLLFVLLHLVTQFGSIPSFGQGVLPEQTWERSFLPSAYCLLQEQPLAATHQEKHSPPKVPAPVVDINQASAEDFAKLPGIGPALAQRIVAYRQKHGQFRRIEDLLAIRGIGHKKWKALRPYLRVNKGPEKGTR